MKTLIFFCALLASFSSKANYDGIKTGDYAEYDAVWVRNGVTTSGHVTFEILDEGYDFHNSPDVRRCNYRDGDNSPVCLSGRQEVYFKFLYFPHHFREAEECWNATKENVTVKVGSYETCLFKTDYPWYNTWDSKWWSTSVLFGLVKSVSKNNITGEETLELRYFKAMPRK